MLPWRLRANPLLSGKLSASRQESGAMQELVGEKDRTGGATMATGLRVYAHSIRLSLEKYDDMNGAWGEALGCRPVVSVKISMRRKQLRI